MENKLQQLTQRLYEEGLEKGRAEAEKRIAEAEQQAAQLLADARREAEEIIREAELRAEDTAKNTETEIALAGKQAVARLKSEIAQLIVARTTADGVRAASLDAAFLKEMMLAVARNWNGAAAGRVELAALLPEAERTRLDAAFAASVRELLAAGIEVGYSERVKTGFRIAEKEGGYYLSFTDADLEALVSEYLREKVAAMLFTRQD